MSYQYIIFIIVAACIWAIVTYNKLQKHMQSIREHLSNLQAALKKRIDLANQIIDIASGYGEHEKLTHLKLSDSQGSLSNVLSLAQNYPELKANQTYQLLMSQLENLEQSILQRRERYNAQVSAYNSFRNSFPALLVATKLNFETAPYFDINDPDFSDKVKIFQRDDSVALQQVINSGANSLKNTTITAKKLVTEKIIDAQQNSNEVEK
jgi:LemA protein